MATGWVKSLQCKSRALEDVVHRHQKLQNNRTNPKNNQHHRLIPDSASCSKSVQSLKDVVETTKQSKPTKSKPLQPPQTPPTRYTKRHFSRKPEPASHHHQPTIRTNRPRTFTGHSHSAVPALTELPEDHPSRNVVEIIFHTSWSPKAFSGRIEMVFKVQNLSRTVSRFEEYREIVKSRADSGVEADVNGGGEDHARCVADGNEVMRFYCLGSTNGGAYDAGGGTWAFIGGKGAAICTFSGSGEAHERAGGGRGRRAMLVCRVIAGRVCKKLGFDSLIQERVECDSVSGDNGGLLVVDSRAVLPCFLVIYKL